MRGASCHGVLISNFLTGDASNDDSDGPAIRATITSNLFYSNGRAIRAAAGDRSTDGGTVTLFMHGNVFRNNRENFQGVAATSRLATPIVGNRLKVRSEIDTFGEAFANIYLNAGQCVSDTDPQDGQIDAKFIRSRFIRDFAETPAEISIIGGSGSNKHARVLFRGATVKTSEDDRTEGGLLIQEQEIPGVGTSQARLVGSQQEFIDRNQGLPAPAAHFFLE